VERAPELKVKKVYKKQAFVKVKIANCNNLDRFFYLSDFFPVLSPILLLSPRNFYSQADETINCRQPLS
jgi:hypothetical protein